jgi:hypothetical protein
LTELARTSPLNVAAIKKVAMSLPFLTPEELLYKEQIINPYVDHHSLWHSDNGMVSGGLLN